MRREVRARIVADVTAEADNVLAVSVADTDLIQFEELVITSDGQPLTPTELIDDHGTRLHRVITPPGQFVVDYHAVTEGVSTAPPVEPIDLIHYLRTSRYAQSDVLAPIAHSLLNGLGGGDLLQAVRDWVNTHLSYVLGSSGPTDGAVDTYLRREGVCRDYAHLCLALLRASDIPARLVAVYAPGLDPMDFHAVVEAELDGAWRVIDATGLAPRESMLRIATGRDAADTAFLTTQRGGLILNELTVTATVDSLPDDDAAALVTLN